MPENNSGGEIISRETADQEFGQASFSLTISSDQLHSLAGQTLYLLMFNIIDDRLIILGDDRKLLYPVGIQVPEETVFTVYSKSKVLELIETGRESDNSVEVRRDKITVTNGDHTLEFGSLCPPWCSQQ